MGKAALTFDQIRGFFRSRESDVAKVYLEVIQSDLKSTGATTKGKGGSGQWTPARRAAQSERIKAALAAKAAGGDGASAAPTPAAAPKKAKGSKKKKGSKRTGPKEVAAPAAAPAEPAAPVAPPVEG